MTRMPGAVWRPVKNYTPGGVTRPPHGMVVHTAVTPPTPEALYGVVNYFDSASSQVSSYFVVGVDGMIIQCVDLDDRAWTQAAGNEAWVGVENIGNGTKEPLTAAQVAANGRILAWLHDTYGVPLQLTNDPVNGRGLGWHGMGGQAWGGHLICPGEFVRAQLTQILAAAIGNPPQPQPTPEKKMDHVWIGYVEGSAGRYIIGAGTKHHIGSPDVYNEWKAQAQLRGLDVLERPCTQAFLDDLTNV